ncbi:MAG TPA: hypothetical protein VF384_10695 [Planctomycetota bacterium]
MNELSTTAKVVAVEATSRIITLRRDDDSLLKVKAGPDVRNFGQIAAGDTLRVQYRETLAAALRPAGTAKSAEAAAAMGRAKPGAAPAAGFGIGVSLLVKIESIDRERDIVVFSVASGEVMARRIVTPEGRGFVKGLQIGDMVQLDYTESLALSIEKI